MRLNPAYTAISDVFCRNLNLGFRTYLRLRSADVERLDVIYGLGTRCENIMLQNIDKIINPILRHCQVHQRDFI